MLAGDGENARVMYEKVLERDSAFYVGYPSTELFDFINNEKNNIHYSYGMLMDFQLSIL